MTITLVPILIALIGLAMMLFTSGKGPRVGEILFFCGLLAICLAQSHTGSITIH